jgi:hypothetical protein
VAKVREPKHKPFDKHDLSGDGLFDIAMSDAAHDAPRPEHIRAAANTLMMEDHEIPTFANVAELVAYVTSVRAAGGDDKAIDRFLDRFSPKVAKAEQKVDHTTFGSPQRSANESEEREAENFMNELRNGGPAARAS